MRVIDTSEVTRKIAEVVQTINYTYPSDIKHLLDLAHEKESGALAKSTLRILQENAKIAETEHLPICQDTGMVIVFMKMGQNLQFTNSITAAIQDGVAQGYETGYLRKSIVDDPLYERINTNTNTPCIIYTELVEDDILELEIATKGFGSENMSTITMLKPAQKEQGVIDAVIKSIKNAGPNACPPMVVGVGIGGTFDYAAVLAKKATIRDTSIANPNPKYQQLEEVLLAKANELNIGPQGFKGDTSVLKVNVEYFPTHIAGLPVAVNISCHITRHAKVVF